MNKKKTNLIKILGLVVTALIIVCVLLFTGIIDIGKNNDPEIIDQPDIDEPIVELKKQPERNIWLKNKDINDDYQGEIVFKSGLINKSFVQATSVYDKNGNFYHFYTENGKLVDDSDGYTGNDVYIWTNWIDMSYDYNILGGSVFMDERNNLNDQNIIIYGHHFSEAGGSDPERVKAFTPMEKLLQQENYEANKYVDLILDNETRSYELVCVYNFDINSSFCLNNTQYWRTNYNYDDFSSTYDDNYYKTYIDSIDEIKLYDTDCILTENDNTLTLQTCISGRAGELFEICVFKLINTEYFQG